MLCYHDYTSVAYRVTEVSHDLWEQIHLFCVYVRSKVNQASLSLDKLDLMYHSSNSAQYISVLPQEEVFTSHAITFCATCTSQLIIMNSEIQSSDYQ